MLFIKVSPKPSKPHYRHDHHHMIEILDWYRINNKILLNLFHSNDSSNIVSIIYSNLLDLVIHSYLFSIVSYSIFLLEHLSNRVSVDFSMFHTIYFDFYYLLQWILIDCHLKLSFIMQCESNYQICMLLVYRNSFI